jgi:hypothetical protein
MGFSWEEIDKIEGWLYREEAELLYREAENMSEDTRWCEIGSWKGKSTVALAQSGRSGIAIDWFRGNPETPKSDTLTEFLYNVAPHSKLLSIYPMKSEHAARWLTDPIGLLFIDGEHTYEAVKQDYELYEPRVVSGGVIIFHDAVNVDTYIPHPYPGVKQFTDELIAAGADYWVVSRCVIVRKP